MPFRKGVSRFFGDLFAVSKFGFSSRTLQDTSGAPEGYIPSSSLPGVWEHSAPVSSPRSSLFVGVLEQISHAIDRSESNKKQWGLLWEGCVKATRLVNAEAVKYNHQNPILERARALEETLKKIYQRVEYYNNLDKRGLCMRFQRITDEITGLLTELDLCLRDALDYVELQRVGELQDMREGELMELPHMVSQLLGEQGLHNQTLGETSMREVFKRLKQHGCYDLTEFISPEKVLMYSVANGGRGDVFKGELHNETTIAIKVWKFCPEEADGDQNLKGVMNELCCWLRIKHENVHQLLGVTIFQGRLGMVSRWMENGDLSRYMNRNKALNKYWLCLQAAEAVQYLHDNGIVHGDLKAQNFLVSSDHLIKLTDFDRSTTSNRSWTLSQPVHGNGGTFRWMAPEFLVDDASQRNNTFTDVYSLGMTILEIVTGAVPYYGLYDFEVVMRLQKQMVPERTVDFEKPGGERVWPLLVQCWSHNPAARPTASNIHDVMCTLRLIDAMESTHPLEVQCTVSLAQVVAELMPLPEIGPLVEYLASVFWAVECARVNREQWILLRGRCVMVMRMAGAEITNYRGLYPGLQKAAHVLKDALIGITTRAEHYNKMSKIAALLRLRPMNTDIKGFFDKLDACLNCLSYSTDFARKQWIHEFETTQEQVMKELKGACDIFSLEELVEGTDPTQEQLTVVARLLGPQLAEKYDIIQYLENALPSPASPSPASRPPHEHAPKETEPIDIGPSSGNPSATSDPRAIGQKWALTQFGVETTLSIAEVAAGIGGVPFLGPTVDFLAKLYQAVEKSRVNKDQWRLLQGRCTMVMYIAGDHINERIQQEYPELKRVDRIREEDYPELTNGVRMLDRTLKIIYERAEYYNNENKILTFLQFRVISEEIEGFFRELDSCLVLFSFEAGLVVKQWTREFRTVQHKELAKLQEVYDCLSDVNVSLSGVNHRLGEMDTGTEGIGKRLGAIDRVEEKVSEIMGVLNKELGKRSDTMRNQDSTTHANFIGAQRVARTILVVTQLKPSAEMLTGEQCVPESPAPIKTSISCDVYIARLLDGEKVAKKVFRIGMSDHDAVTRYANRFNRTAQLWSQFKSDHTLPFYGFGRESFGDGEHSHLYTIAPLMKNSDAVTYLKQYRNNLGMKNNILRIITDAARGLCYLHENDPQVVHSRMQGSNILITDSGGGMLSGFGSIKAIENDYTGNDPIPAPVMTGKSEGQRWMAPELFTADSPPLQTESDVWGWAMTALELVSGLIPYYTHKQTMTIMIKVTQGPPKRKDYAKFNQYAYRPDEMWALLEQCWSMDPDGRPAMDQVIKRLEEIAGMPEHEKASK